MEAKPLMTKANTYADLEVPPLVGSKKGGSARVLRHVQTMFLTICILAVRYIKDNYYILTMVLVFILSGMLAVLLGD